MGRATWGETAKPTSRDQNTRQERRQRKRDEIERRRKEEMIGAQTEAARQSRVAAPATKLNEESSTCA